MTDKPNKSDALVELRFTVTERVGEVSALLWRPVGAKCLIVLAHGAGAGMRHSFMEAIAAKLANFDIATLRYQFPYMERGKRRPDSKATLFATVRAAVHTATKLADDLPLLAGGKSMGGRMTSMLAAEGSLPFLRGLVFFGFPLHAAGKPSSERAEHLFDIDVPMLFLQGSRDTLADLKLLRPICSQLGEPATLHVAHGADHSFHMLKRANKTDDQTVHEIARAVNTWISQFT